MSANLNRARPLRLAGLTLTNSPNNKGGKPITNRRTFIAATTQVHSGPSGALPGVHPQAAADRLLLIANRLQKQEGGTFDSAWNRARLENPRLFNTANVQLTREQYLANRTPQFSDEASAQVWRDAEAVEKAVFDGLNVRQELHRSGSRYSLFVDKWRGMQTVSGAPMTPAEAWEFLKASDPQLFTDAMLEQAEAGRFRQAPRR